MRKKLMKQLGILLLTLIVVTGMLPSIAVHAAEQEETSSWQTCTTYSGNNVEDQNYSK